MDNAVIPGQARNDDFYVHLFRHDCLLARQTEQKSRQTCYFAIDSAQITLRSVRPVEG